MSSLVENSLSNLIANSSHINALVLLTPMFPGFISPSLRYCSAFATRQYKVPREKWFERICCWIGFTRNWLTWGERSWSHERVVSHRWMTMIRIAWVVL